jgi:ABC-type nitrate/sulfonate/bicarbonate transport system ATPase subunit
VPWGTVYRNVPLREEFKNLKPECARDQIINFGKPVPWGTVYRNVPLREEFKNFKPECARDQITNFGKPQEQ